MDSPAPTCQVANVEFRPSPIHGLGGFACQSIPEGARLLEYSGRRISKAESLREAEANNPYLFYLDEETDLDGNIEANLARLLNHSCQPNCSAEKIDGKIWIVASRAIEAGEELTFDYAYDLTDYREHPCHCGLPGCVGYIVAEMFRPLIRK